MSGTSGTTKCPSMFQHPFTIAKKLSENGAELAFTYLGDALKKRVVPLAESLKSNFTLSCDVEKKEDIVRSFEDIKKKWGNLDFVVHAIAFSDRAELSGEYLNTSRENFLKSMLISCFSLTEIAKEASRAMMATIQGELDRLAALRKINENIRQEEIDLTCKQMQELGEALSKARIRLDAIRLIFKGPQENEYTDSEE